ncbi:MAG: DUF3667 domain-containing protein [Acidobacteriota bacterium]
MSSEQCLNCGASLCGASCHVCGQKDQDLDVRFKDLAADWLGSVFSLDGRLWTTLRLLVLRPGQLTLDYLGGRRARFVPPLRLYLIASLVMLIVLSWTGYSMVRVQDSTSGSAVITINQRDESSAEETEGSHSGEDSADPSTDDDAPTDDAQTDDAPTDDAQDDGWWQNAEPVLEAASEDPSAIDRSFRDFLPHALFLLVPGFALELWVLFRRRRRRYMHHLIFSLHTHALVFLVISAATLVDFAMGWEHGPVGDLAVPAMLVYLFLALRRMYGEGRVRTLAKGLVLLVVHLALLMASLLGTFIVATLALARTA